MIEVSRNLRSFPKLGIAHESATFTARKARKGLGEIVACPPTAKRSCILGSHERPGISPVVLARRRKQGLSKQPNGPTPECCAFVAPPAAPRPDPGPRRRPARSPRSTSAGSSSPAKSHITVRSFASTWKHRPWSIPQIRPLPVDDEMAALAVAVVRRGGRTPLSAEAGHGGGARSTA